MVNYKHSKGINPKCEEGTIFDTHKAYLVIPTKGICTNYFQLKFVDFDVFIPFVMQSSTEFEMELTEIYEHCSLENIDYGYGFVKLQDKV